MNEVWNKGSCHGASPSVLALDPPTRHHRLRAGGDWRRATPHSIITFITETEMRSFADDIWTILRRLDSGARFGPRLGLGSFRCGGAVI